MACAGFNLKINLTYNFDSQLLVSLQKSVNVIDKNQGLKRHK